MPHEQVKPSWKSNYEKSSVEDYSFPQSIVSRISKSVQPSGIHIQKSAVAAISEGTTIFINYLASAANETAGQRGRKAIAPDDVFKALEALELREFIPRLEEELNSFKSKIAARTVNKQKGDSNTLASSTERNEATSHPTAAETDGAPVQKKARPDDSAGRPRLEPDESTDEGRLSDEDEEPIEDDESLPSDEEPDGVPEENEELGVKDPTEGDMADDEAMDSGSISD